MTASLRFRKEFAIEKISWKLIADSMLLIEFKYS